MKKRTLTVLVVALVCTFLTACSKEIDTMTESVNEKESSVIENPTVLEDTTEIVFPEQFEALSGYDEEALVDYLKENSDGNYQKIECIDGQVNMVATQEEIEYWKGYVEKHIDDQKAVLTVSIRSTMYVVMIHITLLICTMIKSFHLKKLFHAWEKHLYIVPCIRY